MAVTDYINLQVRRDLTQNNQVAYQFRVESFDTNTKTLSNYRILAYINHNFARAQVVLSTQQGQSFGGASGNPNLTITSTYYDAQSGLPPRIAPTSYNSTAGLFNQRIKCRFTTGSLDAVGEGYDQIRIAINHTGFKQYDRLDTNGQPDYEGAYSVETGGSYTDNATFILEYNDIDPADPDSSNWQKVTEVTDSGGTVDSSTGEYPYGDTDVDDTTKDHTIYNPVITNEIRENSPNNNYDTLTTIDVNRQADVRRCIYKYDLSALVAGDSIDRAVMFQYLEICSVANSDQFDYHRLTEDIVETEVTWNDYSSGNSWSTAGGDYDATPETTFTPNDSDRTGNSNDYQDVFLKTEYDQFVIDVKNGTVSNYGIINKYNNEGNFNTNQFETSTDDNGVAGEHPFFVVAGVGSGTGGGGGIAEGTGMWFDSLF